MMVKANPGLFPTAFDINQDAQMKASNVVYKSSLTKDDDYICVECAKEGKASFVCSLCKERRQSRELQESFGDPSDCLCRVCYETVPAKTWAIKVKELETAHKYDWG
jgi:hypothetical protein